MSKKIAKGLWITTELAAEFDHEVKRLAKLMPGRLETGEVGAAALWAFIRLSDKEKFEAIRYAKNHALDKVIGDLPSSQAKRRKK